MPRKKDNPVIITPQLIADLETMKLTDFSLKYAITRGWASILRSRYHPHLHKRIARVTESEILPDLGKMSDVAVGVKHNISPASARRIRINYGIAPYQPKYKWESEDVPVVRSCIFKR